MTRADVAAAINRLRSQGKAVSVRGLRRTLGGGSLRDIIKYRNSLLPRGTAAPVETVPPGPVVVEKPLVLCVLCGYSAWFEWTPNEWRCRLCGRAPALSH
jgi:hypothetical protein